MNKTHLSDESILLALDGELAPREGATVKVHLEACWSCRARRDEIQQIINSVVEYRNHDSLVGQFLPRPGNGRATFIANLDRLIERAGQPSMFRRWMAHLSRNRWPLAFAATTVVLLLFAGFRLAKAPGVSASVLLSRAEASEQLGVNGVSRPVIYQKIRIRSAKQTLTRTTWRDVASHVQVDDLDSRASSIQATMASAGFDWRKPLSAADYSSWRNRQRDKNEDVQLVGQGLLAVSTSTRTGQVLEARLTVRERDWHPVAERLLLQDSSELEMTELEYQVLSLDKIDPSIFGDASSSLLLPEAAPRVIVQPIDGSFVGPKGPAEQQLAEAELLARLALHRLKAEVGEEIEIVRMGDTIEVRAVVDTPQRKEELAGELTGIDLVQPQILTLQEAAARKNYSRVNAPIVLAELARTATEPLLQRVLEKQFPAVEDRSRFIDQALDFAQEAVWHALALHQLALRYPASALVPLSDFSRRELAHLLADHVSALRHQVRAERALVSAVLPVDAGDAVHGFDQLPVENSAADWNTSAGEVWPLVHNIQAAVVALFGGSSPAYPNELSASNELRTSLARVEAMLPTLAQQVNLQVLAQERGVNK